MANKKGLNGADHHQGRIISPVCHYFQTQTLHWINDSVVMVDLVHNKTIMGQHKNSSCAVVAIRMGVARSWLYKERKVSKEMCFLLFIKSTLCMRSLWLFVKWL